MNVLLQCKSTKKKIFIFFYSFLEGDAEEVSKEIATEKVKKPKRQAGRKANTVTKEKPSESALPQTDDNKPAKRATKRTRTQSNEIQTSTEKLPPTVDESIAEQMGEEKNNKRATKRAKAQPIEIQKGTPQMKQSDGAGENAAIEKTSKNSQVEKKPKRGKANAAVSHNFDTEPATPDAPKEKRRLRDRTASVQLDSAPKVAASDENIDKEPAKTDAPIGQRRLRDRTASIHVDNVQKPTKSTNSKQAKPASAPTPAPPNQIDDSNQLEKKSKRATKQKDNDQTDPVAQTPPRKRSLRARTVSKSEENLSKEAETVKPKGKRGRKAEDEADALVEVQEQPKAKRGRTTKKTATQNEVEPKPSTSESKAVGNEKKVKKETKSIEANAAPTSPISTRTRQRK